MSKRVKRVDSSARLYKRGQSVYSITTGDRGTITDVYRTAKSWGYTIRVNGTRTHVQVLQEDLVGS